MPLETSLLTREGRQSPKPKRSSIQIKIVNISSRLVGEGGGGVGRRGADLLKVVGRKEVFIFSGIQGISSRVCFFSVLAMFMFERVYLFVIFTIVICEKNRLFVCLMCEFRV